MCFPLHINLSANAIVERRNSVLRRQLYALMEAAKNQRWVANLPTVVIKNVNETPNLTTHTPPVDLIKGGELC